MGAVAPAEYRQLKKKKTDGLWTGWACTEQYGPKVEKIRPASFGPKLGPSLPGACDGDQNKVSLTPCSHWLRHKRIFLLFLKICALFFFFRLKFDLGGFSGPPIVV